MREWTINFDCERKPLIIKGSTFAKAVEEAQRALEKVKETLINFHKENE